MTRKIAVTHEVLIVISIRWNIFYLKYFRASLRTKLISLRKNCELGFVLTKNGISNTWKVFNTLHVWMCRKRA